MTERESERRDRDERSDTYGGGGWECCYTRSGRRHAFWHDEARPAAYGVERTQGEGRKAALSRHMGGRGDPHCAAVPIGLAADPHALHAGLYGGCKEPLHDGGRKLRMMWRGIDGANRTDIAPEIGRHWPCHWRSYASYTLGSCVQCGDALSSVSSRGSRVAARGGLLHVFLVMRQNGKSKLTRRNLLKYESAPSQRCDSRCTLAVR